MQLREDGTRQFVKDGVLAGELNDLRAEAPRLVDRHRCLAGTEDLPQE
jgi:hypothetical protein